MRSGNPYNPASQTAAFLEYERNPNRYLNAHEFAWEDHCARQAEEYRLTRQRERNAVQKERKKQKAAWVAGVAKIMAEVRRREAVAKPRVRVPAVYWRAPNPLDGTRLWGNS